MTLRYSHERYNEAIHTALERANVKYLLDLKKNRLTERQYKTRLSCYADLFALVDHYLDDADTPVFKNGSEALKVEMKRAIASIGRLIADKRMRDECDSERLKNTDKETLIEVKDILKGIDDMITGHIKKIQVQTTLF